MSTTSWDVKWLISAESDISHGLLRTVVAYSSQLRIVEFTLKAGCAMHATTFIKNAISTHMP
jgi:hypothetical protein